MEKLIITAAITGSRITRETAPYIPITPEEIVQSAIECRQAGASIVHIHVRDPNTGQGTQDLEIFKQVVEPLRAKTDLVLCLTTSGIPGKNIPIAERLAPLELKPELASFDAGSINLGGAVFINSPEFLERAAEEMRARGVKPELEIFDLGMLITCLRLLDEKKIDASAPLSTGPGDTHGGLRRRRNPFSHLHELYSRRNGHLVCYRHRQRPSAHVHDGPGHGRPHPRRDGRQYLLFQEGFWPGPMPSLWNGL